MTIKKKQDKKVAKDDVVVKRKEYVADYNRLLGLTLWLFGGTLFLLFIIGLLVPYWVEIRLDDIESPLIEPSNPLEGWVEVCANTTVVEKYKLIEPLSFDKCMIIYDGAYLCDFESIKAYCEMRSSIKPRIEYYNETICTKYLWVRYD